MNNIVQHILLILVAFFAFSKSVLGQESTVQINQLEYLIDVSSNIKVFEDSSNALTLEEVVNKEFYSTGQKVSNLGITKSTVWVKLELENKSIEENFILNISLPILDYIGFYYPEKNQYQLIETGENFNFNHRNYKDPDYLLDISLKPSEKSVYYLKIRSSEAIQLPMVLGTKKQIFERIKNRDVLSGIYFGIMMVMILYNLFVYFTVRDKSYIYYVLFILLILLTQTSLQGYPFQYLWPNVPSIANYSLFLLPCLSGIFGMIFMNVFLNVTKYSKRIIPATFVFSFIYLISILFALLDKFDISQKIMEINAMLVSLFMLGTSIFILRKGFQPAKYFLVAWSIFLLGVIAFILKDLEVLPYNNFTRYTMQIGSGIETILLSFALAARINIYKKERLEAIEEKEKLAREQNVILEQTVKERTSELNQTLSDLKDTQSQLVDAEKMSSLGQLTAGIAHEINNPINFVSSNISPLRRDLDDLNLLISKYEELEKSTDIPKTLKEIEALKKELDFDYLKTEIPSIINGIEDGANRTKEIVSGLRNFSHLDEAEQQTVDINKGVESTLILIKTKFHNITLNKDLGELPLVECSPSKLNQVFMNLIDNAIGAIEEKEYQEEEPLVTVKTYADNTHIYFSVEDNGVGMNETTKEKMFEPFFTTKEVGEGTGLGLSIVYGIIENHKGEINVESEPSKGTTVTIKIPIK